MPSMDTRVYLQLNKERSQMIHLRLERMTVNDSVRNGYRAKP